MGKDKLIHFDEISRMDHVIQPKMADVIQDAFPLKGRWNSDFFKNDNPIVIELGCGKGEYTVGLAKRYPNKNFIGIDIKGARIWRGAKTVQEESMPNAGFLRTQIDFITAFFEEGEVDEIWITFPDPQEKKNRARKRLTGPFFLERYRIILKQGGAINLKTDSTFLYEFTEETIAEYGHKKLENFDDLYSESQIHLVRPELKEIRTFYEDKFRQKGNTIKYVRFALNNSIPDWISGKILRPYLFFDEKKEFKEAPFRE
jgi:tRNA (guanine-N7-)-methyltransferase